MNNATEILWADDKTVQPLHFGQMALEEFLALNIDPSLNNTRQICNVIYAGAYQAAARERKPAPQLADIFDKIEELMDDEGKVKRVLDVLQVFQESRFGKNLNGVTENLKKKVAEQESQSASTSSKSESSPMESYG